MHQVLSVERRCLREEAIVHRGCGIQRWRQVGHRIVERDLRRCPRELLPVQRLPSILAAQQQVVDVSFLLQTVVLSARDHRIVRICGVCYSIRMNPCQQRFRVAVRMRRGLSGDDHAIRIQLVQIDRRPLHHVSRVAEDIVRMPAVREVMPHIEGLVRRTLVQIIVRRPGRRIAQNVAVVVPNRHHPLRTVHRRNAAVR